MEVKDKDIQSLLGKLLRAGVFTSLVCTTIGGIIYLYHNGWSSINYNTFENTSLHRISFFSSHDPLGVYIIKIGVLVLILTPIARVLFSLVAFFLEKDYLYTTISTIVLIIMICSMVFGVAG